MQLKEIAERFFGLTIGRSGTASDRPVFRKQFEVPFREGDTITFHDLKVRLVRIEERRTRQRQTMPIAFERATAWFATYTHGIPANDVRITGTRSDGEEVITLSPPRYDPRMLRFAGGCQFLLVTPEEVVHQVDTTGDSP